jgi:hypothetical protein
MAPKQWSGSGSFKRAAEAVKAEREPRAAKDAKVSGSNAVEGRNIVPADEIDSAAPSAAAEDLDVSAPAVSSFDGASASRWLGGSKRRFALNTAASSSSSQVPVATPQPDTIAEFDEAKDTAAQEEASADTFRKVIANMFLSNKLSAHETHDIVHSSTAAGAHGVSDLAKAGKSGAHPQNLHRDILKKTIEDVRLAIRILRQGACQGCCYKPDGGYRFPIPFAT